jgi:hypothetical protein
MTSLQMQRSIPTCVKVKISFWLSKGTYVGHGIMFLKTFTFQYLAYSKLISGRKEMTWITLQHTHTHTHTNYSYRQACWTLFNVDTRILPKESTVTWRQSRKSSSLLEPEGSFLCHWIDLERTESSNTITSHFCKIHFNIILLSKPVSPK